MAHIFSKFGWRPSVILWDSKHGMKVCELNEYDLVEVPKSGQNGMEVKTLIFDVKSGCLRISPGPQNPWIPDSSTSIDVNVNTTRSLSWFRRCWVAWVRPPRCGAHARPSTSTPAAWSTAPLRTSRLPGIDCSAYFSIRDFIVFALFLSPQGLILSLLCSPIELASISERLIAIRNAAQKCWSQDA